MRIMMMMGMVMMMMIMMMVMMMMFEQEEYAGQVEEGEMSEAIVTVDATDRWRS